MPRSIQPAGVTAAESWRPAAGAGVLSPATSGGIGSTQGVVDVNSAVTELLQSVGGGVEDDKLLRMLIVLMILLALFENQQTHPAGSNDALGAASGLIRVGPAFE